MKARSLFLVVGAALPGLAQELLPSNGGDHPVVQSERSQHASSAQPYPRRRLQLHLKDDSGEEPVARSDVAYAALLMDDHDRGIRTLGQSLIDTRTSADLVAILGAGVTKPTEERMRAQGWRIRRLAVDEVGVGVGGDGTFDMDSASASVSSVIPRLSKMVVFV